MRGIRVGRLFGVDVRIDWSWALIFVLLTWNLVACSRCGIRSGRGRESAVSSRRARFLSCASAATTRALLVGWLTERGVRSIASFVRRSIRYRARARSATAEFFYGDRGPLTRSCWVRLYRAPSRSRRYRARRPREGRAARMQPLGPRLRSSLLGRKQINVVIGSQLDSAFPSMRTASASGLWTLRELSEQRSGRRNGQAIGWPSLPAGNRHELRPPYVRSSERVWWRHRLASWLVLARARRPTARLKRSTMRSAGSPYALMQTNVTTLPRAQRGSLVKAPHARRDRRFRSYE